jgi:nucleotide-binding universal stress UspA family protein/hemerythrin-like domain-containing protein
MYCHILVPTDGSELSTRTSSRAIDLAKQLGARITFLYVNTDSSSSLTSDASLVQLLLPEQYEFEYSGQASEILAKVQVAAVTHQIDFQCCVRTQSHRHEAILKTSTELGCDLIMMGSRGQRFASTTIGSVTLKVLAASSIPVLVSSNEKNDPYPSRSKVTSIFKDEHRAIAVICYALRAYAQNLRDGLIIDTDLLRSMLVYLDEFPAKFHHPKEDAYLFPAIKKRTHEFDEMINALQRHHAAEEGHLKSLLEVVVRYSNSPREVAEELATIIDQAAFYELRHITLEEAELIPGAIKHLLPSDWDEIARAFSSNGDPCFEPEKGRNYKLMFSRIAYVLHSNKPDEYK